MGQAGMRSLSSQHREAAFYKRVAFLHYEELLFTELSMLILSQLSIISIYLLVLS